MTQLKGFQRKYLKGLAHGLKPVVFIGQKGLTESVTMAMDGAFNAHELIKIRFIDFKEKEHKEKITAAIEETTGSEIVGSIGHILILYRQHKDPKKRIIQIPERLEIITSPKKKGLPPELLSGEKIPFKNKKTSSGVLEALLDERQEGR